MSDLLQGERFRLLHGDSRELLKTLDENSVDAICTDPPAGVAFMNKDWDSDKGGRDAWIEWLTEIMAECLRVLKPGGHAVVWSLPRTSHWTAMALEDAGFEIRDCLLHLFGSGFPKSLGVGKAIDKAAGAEREVVGRYTRPDGTSRTTQGGRQTTPFVAHTGDGDAFFSAPATDAAKEWDGWGSSLKPSQEMWWLCRKPLSESSIAANVLKWKTGALNIAATRVGVSPQKKGPWLSSRHNASCDTPDAFLCILQSADTLSAVVELLLNELRGIAFALRSYNSSDKAPSHNGDVPDDIEPSGEPDNLLRNRLFPNGVWCGLNLRAVLDSPVDCPTCLRFCDERFRGIQEAAQASPALLADVLDDIRSGLSEYRHNLHCVCNGHPSNWGVSQHVVALVRLLKDGVAYSARQQKPAGQRWPPNVCLTHSLGCRRRSWGQGSLLDAETLTPNGHDGTRLQNSAAKRQFHYTDDGDEWECDPSCCVAELARQGGGVRPGGPAQLKRRSGLGYHGGKGTQADETINYPESSVDRFFPQFAYSDDDFWPFKYCAKASRGERDFALESLPKSQKMKLKDDLTPEQIAFVQSELRKAGVDV